MLTVSISVNGKAIYTRSAVNIKQMKHFANYKLDDGTILLHNTNDGAVVLAKKMLDTIVEV